MDGPRTTPSRPCIHLLLLSKIPALSLSTQGTSTATRYCSIPPPALLRLTTPNNPNPNLRFSSPPSPYSLSPTPLPVPPRLHHPLDFSRASRQGLAPRPTSLDLPLRCCPAFQVHRTQHYPEGWLRVIPSLSRGALQRWSPPSPTTASPSTTPDERTTPPQRHLERRPPHLVRRDLCPPENDLDLQPAVGLPSNTGSLVSWRPLCRAHRAESVLEEASLAKIGLWFSDHESSMDGQVASSFGLQMAAALCRNVPR